MNTITPPTDSVATRAILDLARSAEFMARDLNVTTAGLPETGVPLFSVVDLTAAAAHLRQASRLIDRAVRGITAGADL